MATIRHGAAAMAVLYTATTPIYTVILRRAFGVAGGAFADPDDGTGTRVSWLPLTSLSLICYVSFLLDAGHPATGAAFLWKEVSRRRINDNYMQQALRKREKS